MKTPALFRATASAAALLLSAGAANAQRIQMPLGYRLTWIGARWNPGARVVDSKTGQAVAATLAYRVADPDIATVNTRGEVVARKPGTTRLWAVAGRDSASALIVVDQLTARYSFSPAAIRIDALTARQPIRVLASDSAGVPIVGGTNRVSTCRSVNDRVATLSGADVVAVGNGTTWIRCSDRGLADSIRVDVQQRANSAQITNKVALRSRTAGDTFSVRVSTKDKSQKEISDARPSYVSLNPAAVSVDPVTGKARAVNGGEARIIAQVGDVADTVSVSVTGSTLAAVIPQPVAPSDTAPKSKAQLIAQEVFVFEGETIGISVMATDSAGEQRDLSGLTFRLLDTTVAKRVDSTSIVGRKSGQTQMVVRLGNLTDTTTVNVRPKSSVDSSQSSISLAGRTSFKAPTIPDSATEYRRRLSAVDDSIHTDPNLAAARLRFVVNPIAVGAIAEHLVRTEAGVLEDRTGPLYGGGGSLVFFQKLELTGVLRKGTLSSVDTIGEDLKVTEFEGNLGYFPIPQLGLRTGVVMRGEESKLATATWFVPKVSLVTRFTFIGDIVSCFAAISVLPKAKFSGLDSLSGSLFSRGGEAGLDFRRARVNAGISYFVEQLTFTESDRFESFSAIRLKFGYNLGR